MPLEAMPIYRIAGWNEVGRGVSCLSGSVTSVTVDHTSDSGKVRAYVASSLPNPQPEMDWYYQLSNMLIRVTTERFPHRTQRRRDRLRRSLWTDIQSARVPTLATAISVDGTDAEFEVISIDAWTAALGRRPTVTIGIWARNVDLTCVALTSEP